MCLLSRLWWETLGELSDIEMSHPASPRIQTRSGSADGLNACFPYGPQTNMRLTHRTPFLKAGANEMNRNTAWMMLGNGARVVIQALYFILMARNLGPKQYGVFVAVTAAVAVVSPFVGNGCASLMIKHVAQDRMQFAESLGNLLAVTLLSGLLLSALTAPVCLVLLPRQIAPAVIMMILVSDVLVFPYVGVAGVAFWSLERLGWAAALNIFASSMRLIGIAVIVMLHRPTLIAWSLSYLVTSAVASMVALGCVLRFLGMPKLRLRRIKSELWEGFHFSVGLSAQTIYNNIDKTMLARLGTLEGTGIYGAAYRLIDVAFLPVTALLSAAYPGFFRCGKDGIHATMLYGQKLMKRILPYSLFVFAALMLGAPMVPRVLGREYYNAAEALRWLAVLPLVKTFHYFIADSLTGAGYQGLRTLVQLGIAAFNILVNLWIIPAYGWRGAAWSSIASDGLLALVLWLIATHLAGKTRQMGSTGQPEPSEVPCLT
jgi:O-antigen/teichoic acid export membrane protein